MRNSPFVIGIILIVGFAWLSSSLLSDKEKAKIPQDFDIQSAVDQAVSLKLNETPKTEIIAQNSALANIPLILPIPKKLMFCGEEVPLDDPDVLERFERELYITAHRYYQVVFYLKRGPRIFPRMKEILREEKAPLDLIYLSTIESDLIPNIRSPKGALGLWQFMPATAKAYRLKIDRYVDERMHTEKSTRAAIKYLKDSHSKLGSWTLAAAAYNMGLARTKRSVSEQKSDDYYKLYMNPETSRYVFRILAAKVIIENPELYGYYMPESEVYTYEQVKKVHIRAGIIDLPLWAQKNGITYYDLKRYNPWIINQSLPIGNFEVEIPS